MANDNKQISVDFVGNTSKEIAMSVVANNPNIESINVRTIAQYCGVKDDRLELLTLFTDEDFDDSRICLHPDMVKEWFSDGTSDSSVPKYIKFALVDSKKFEIGKDYFILNPENPADKMLIDRAMNIITRGTPHIKIPIARGVKPIFYAVTGACLIGLLLMARTEKGHLMRLIFMDIKKIMIIYQKAIHILMHREAERSAIQHGKDIKLLEDLRKNPVIHPIIRGPAHYDRDECMYIAADEKMNRDANYKFGIVRDGDFDGRLSNYDTGRPTSEQMGFKYLRKCENAYKVESLVHAIVQAYVSKSKKHENVILPFNTLTQIIDCVIDAEERGLAILEALEKRRETTEDDAEPILPNVELIAKVAKITPRLKIHICAKCERKYASVAWFNLHIKKCNVEPK